MAGCRKRGVGEDKAERIFWNALAFNQWINGSFGLRCITPNGYGMHELHEAWCCCVHHAGMAMTEYARHAVTLGNQTVRINLLVAGHGTGHATFDLRGRRGGDLHLT